MVGWLCLRMGTITLTCLKGDDADDDNLLLIYTLDKFNLVYIGVHTHYLLALRAKRNESSEPVEACFGEGTPFHRKDQSETLFL